MDTNTGINHKNTELSSISIIAAIVLIVQAIVGLNGALRVLFFTPIPIIGVLASIFLAVVLFMRRRDNLLLIAYGCYALHSLLVLLLWNRDVTLIKYGGHVSDFISLISILLLVGFACCVVLKGFEKHSAIVKKVWVLPGLLAVVNILVFVWERFGHYSTSQFLAIYRSGLINLSLNILFRVFSALWLAYSYRTSAKQYSNSTGATNTTVQEGEGYCDLLKHILLLLFTFGIWNLIWIYRTTGYLNKVNDEPPRNPTNKLLLCMFVPFYSIYWTYKSAQRLDKLAPLHGVSSDLTTLCLILAIFVGIIPPILMQQKINEIATGKNDVNTYKSNNSNAEELKKYKDLLDSGAITQEEYDTKKKQLLGL